ncbi:MAG: exodeoxyribonuclease VII small subunit [Gammaproteobacteria bacterium]|nr:exodeoxyribonuclease VII small subunit [Gammaproteobacteria bacterium]
MKTTPKKSSTLIESQSFEDVLTELESIISAMEVGQMPLQETLDAYKRGMILLRQCQETLNAAEQQIRILENNTLRPFKPDTFSELEDK